MREIDGFKASGRYNSGYRHWIEGCLRHGASLYIAQVDPNGEYTIDEIENFLIANYPSEMPQKLHKSVKTFSIGHTGDVPASLLNSVLNL